MENNNPDHWTQCDLCHRPIHPAALQGVTATPGQWHPGCEFPPGNCPCSTPWDDPQPQLEIEIRGRIPPRECLPIPNANLHVTERADRVLRGLSLATNDRWVIRSHSRVHQVWAASVTGGTAVIQQPRFRGTRGYHCVACHRDFANQAIASVHRRDLMDPCRNPALVLDSMTGRLLLEQTRVGGSLVWGWSKPLVDYETAMRALGGVGGGVRRNPDMVPIWSPATGTASEARRVFRAGSRG